MPSDCSKLDPLVTPYVDGELDSAARDAVDAHLRVCPPCHSRVAAERSVRTLLADRRRMLRGEAASSGLRARCADCTSRDATGSWRTRLAPLALAASLVVVVGGAFLYVLTVRSDRVMAAELTADHVKCFALNEVVSPAAGADAIARLMKSQFDWNVQLPARPDTAGLQLVGARPCLYGEGRVAHLMYRHHGQPVSVFMLPQTVRPADLVNVMGHEAAIWTVDGRTFVLIAREPRADVQRMASFVSAGLH